MSFGRGILWTNLGLPVRLGPVDGRATIFIVLAAYHWAIWTLVLAMVGILVLFWIERIGYTIPNLFRKIRVIMTGSYHPAQSERRLRSYR